MHKQYNNINNNVFVITIININFNMFNEIG